MNQEDINIIISNNMPEWQNNQVWSEDAYMRLQAKYHELLMAVGMKFAGETRHQTALRYIRQAEEPKESAGNAA